MAPSVRPAASRFDHQLKARRRLRSVGMTELPPVTPSSRSVRLCPNGHPAPPNAQPNTADALRVVAGRPIPLAAPFRETFSRQAASWGVRPPQSGAGCGGGWRAPPRHFAASPCHPGGQVTCHRRADLECPIGFTGVRGAPETLPRSTLKSASIRRNLSTLRPIRPVYPSLRRISTGVPSWPLGSAVDRTRPAEFTRRRRWTPPEHLLCEVVFEPPAG
jgi:hypothetical protein